MKSFVDEENKDGRHFPTDMESQVLIQYLQVYFSHPERSMQRSQVVQNVVSILSATNKHWTHRTVRLWFNNNKKAFFHPQPGAMPEPRQEQPTMIPQSPVNRYVPPRSSSVVHLGAYAPTEVPKARMMGQFVMGMDPYAQPKQGSLANHMLKEVYEKIHTLQDQELAEASVSEKIASLHDQKWKLFVGAQPCRSAITESKPDAAKVIPELVEVVPYDLINSSLAGDVPIVVSYNMESQCQMLNFNGMETNIEMDCTVTSIAFDQASDLIWVNGGSVLKAFDASDLRLAKEEVQTGKRSAKTAMLMWGGNLVVASGSTIQRWAQPDADSDDDVGPMTLIDSWTLLVPSITALATVSDSLVVASSEYHTAQVYADNGASVKRAIGHTAGVTALHGFDENMFISGSADQTVKLWDLRDQVPAANILKHRGIVTAVFGDAQLNDYLIVSGGTDGMIKGWDRRMMDQSVFAFSVGEGAPQSIHCVPDVTSEGGERQGAVASMIVTLSERTSDAYYDMGKFGMIQTDVELPPNAVLTYRFPQ